MSGLIICPFGRKVHCVKSARSTVTSFHWCKIFIWQNVPWFIICNNRTDYKYRRIIHKRSKISTPLSPSLSKWIDETTVFELVVDPVLSLDPDTLKFRVLRKRGEERRGLLQNDVQIQVVGYKHGKASSLYLIHW